MNTQLLLPAPSLDRYLNRVTHSDAIDFLCVLPSGSIDAIVSDPPYNTTELDFETVIDWPLFWLQARRVLKRKNSPVILFSAQPFTTDLIMSNRKGWRDEIVYHKTMPTGYLNANRAPLECHELIEIFADAGLDYFPQMEVTTRLITGTPIRTGADHYNQNKSLPYNDNGSRYPRSVWTFAQRNTSFQNTKTLHPTEKPLPLMRRLLLTYTRAGEVILDPFCGSGSTLVAAQELGRLFVGGDNKPKYCEVARSRLAQPFTVSMFA